MFYAIIILGSIGLFFGILLGFVNKKLNIKVDLKENLILNALPGANCGACGFPGCSACASAILNNKTPINSCTVGGSITANKIAKILNIKSENIKKNKINIHCKGSINNTKNLYNYFGISNCSIAKTSFNGPKICDFACLGLGSCSKACPFNAIEIKNGLPKINYIKCTACGICVNICPQNILQLIPEKQNIAINCRNINKGKEVLSFCNVGCIKCKKCEKICRYNAISVINIAKIDYKKCTNCKECITVCPTHCITLV